MKIRSYKGASLEKLYEVINKEMGPNAVVVPIKNKSGLGSFLSPERHELIAIVDDASAESHAAARAERPEYIEKFAAFHAEKWKSQESMLRELRSEIRSLSSKTMLSGMASADAEAPGFARGWDPRFLARVRSSMPAGPDRNEPAAVLKETARCLNVREGFKMSKRRGKPGIVVLVGPTGSGKTTTLAKLAARWCLEQDLNVGLITTDTYRIAAVDQLKEYATLLGVDLRVAFSAGEAAAAARSLADKDVILVDTPGRSQYDKLGMAALRGTLSRLGDTTVFLVVPAVMNPAAVPDVLKSFGSLQPHYLVVTKSDESPRLQIMTTLMCETDCPVAFLTNGQRVPQDIQEANRDAIARMLVPQSSLRSDSEELENDESRSDARYRDARQREAALAPA
jgi:flagellar biosynthesis GTPase FlhF